MTTDPARTLRGTASPIDQEALAEAARLLRRLLVEVEAGRVPAPSGRDAALVRRIEGAATALEAAAQHPTNRRGGDR